MHKIIKLILVVCLLLSGASLTPRQVTALSPINCGQITEENIPLLDTGTPTTKDRAAAKCMTEAMFSCDAAHSTIYSKERDETVNASLLGLSGDNCQIYFEQFSSDNESSICTVPMDFIEYAESQQEEIETELDPDFLFHVVVSLLAISSGFGSNPTYGDPPQDLEIVCTDPTPTPTLTKLEPSVGPVGTTVTFTGSGFLAQNEVNYNGPAYGSGTVSNVSSANGTSAQFQVPAWLPPGVYNLAIANSNGLSEYLTFTVVGSTTGTPHAVGSNVAGPEGTVYFITTHNTRSPYTSAGAFLSYKFNSWSNVMPANAADLALPLSTFRPIADVATQATYFIPPRNGSLINDHGTVYLITNGARIGFASAQVFSNLNYSFANVYPGDTSFMNTLAPLTSAERVHPDGALINDNGTLYIINNGRLMGFPNLAVFNSWGYWLSEAATANRYDQLLPVHGVIDLRQVDQLNIGSGQPEVDVQANGFNDTLLRAEGETVILSWTSTNASVCSFGGSGHLFTDSRLSSPIPLSGEIVIDNVTVGDNSTNIIELVCYNNNVYPATSASDKVTVEVVKLTPTSRDQKRLTDVRQMASALELYFNDNNSYPQSLSQLTPNYIIALPQAPTPTDGKCTATQNSYTYTFKAATSYSLTFCLGSTTGGVGAGLRTLSEAGIQ